MRWLRFVLWFLALLVVAGCATTGTVTVTWDGTLTVDVCDSAEER